MRRVERASRMVRSSLRRLEELNLALVTVDSHGSRGRTTVLVVGTTVRMIGTTVPVVGTTVCMIGTTVPVVFILTVTVFFTP